VVEGDHTWRQFTPFELVWAGGILGRAASQMRVWIKRASDAYAERRARARELARRQPTEFAPLPPAADTTTSDSIVPGGSHTDELSLALQKRHERA
jgi:hypothetical protein